jgi:hypothetical protein
LINWGLSGYSRSLCAIVLRRFFKSDRPRGVSAKNAISFLQSFFLCGYNAKEKSVKRPLISKPFSRFL